MKKRQREVRLMRAGIQLAFFIAAPSLFSTAFAGIKSIFLAIAAGYQESGISSDDESNQFFSPLRPVSR